MESVRLNPTNPAPPDVISEIVPVSVTYLNVSLQESRGTIEINHILANDILAFFNRALELRFPIERVVRSSDAEFAWQDGRLTAANATSGFNYRTIAGTDRVSLHGLGRAFDVNCRLNPFFRFVDDDEIVDPPGATYNPAVSGTLYADHPLVIFMKNRGWVWGGDWTRESGRIDYQHFEKPA